MEMPVELTDSVVRSLALEDLAAALRSAPEYGANGRNAQTLAKAAEMNIMLTVVAAGTQLGEHQVEGPVALTVLDGEIAFISGGGEQRVQAGSAVVFAGGVRHSVRAIEDAAFLLVITRHG